jgi:radical SAM superfamily enzyme YgiQ (UPF0313 family)
MSENSKNGYPLSVCLVYPNLQKLGLSYLGFHKIYSALNAICDCDIAFLTEEGGKPRSNFQNKPLGNFDLLAFSITFETDILNLFSILTAAGVPLEQDRREHTHPLVCAGGIAPTLNPEPFAIFLDFMVIGEGELTLEQWVKKLADNRALDRAERLAEIAAVDGVYVPSLYEVEIGERQKIISRRPLGAAPEKVNRLYDRAFAKSGSAQVFDEETVFKDSWLIETGKGCGQGCRFCAAGFIYRPVRHVGLEKLSAQIDEGLKLRKRVGLIGSAICEHPRIKDVYSKIIEKGGGVNVSSLRVGYVDEDMLKLLVKGGLHTMTIAPEAGSERLRRAVNKDVSDDEIVTTVGTAVSAGMANIKLYFLIGLPGEQADDVTAIVGLVKRLRDELLNKSKQHGRAGKIMAAINPFVPKAQTPFQWESLAPQKELKNKMAEIRSGLARESNVELKLESAKHAAPQALLSVGNRNAGKIALEAFRDGNWKIVQKRYSNFNAFFHGGGMDEILPWDFIDSGVTKEYLWKEREKSYQGKTTAPCLPEMAGCKRCGEFEGNCY